MLRRSVCPAHAALNLDGAAGSVQLPSSFGNTWPHYSKDCTGLVAQQVSHVPAATRKRRDPAAHVTCSWRTPQMTPCIYSAWHAYAEPSS